MFGFVTFIVGAVATAAKEWNFQRKKNELKMSQNGKKKTEKLEKPVITFSINILWSVLFPSVNVDNVHIWEWMNDIFLPTNSFNAVSELVDYLNYRGVGNQQCAKMPNI